MKFIVLDLSKPDSWNNVYKVDALKKDQIFKIDTVVNNGQIFAVIYYNDKEA